MQALWKEYFEFAPTGFYYGLFIVGLSILGAIITIIAILILRAQGKKIQHGKK